MKGPELVPEVEEEKDLHRKKSDTHTALTNSLNVHVTFVQKVMWWNDCIICYYIISIIKSSPQPKFKTPHADIIGSSFWWSLGSGGKRINAVMWPWWRRTMPRRSHRIYYLQTGQRQLLGKLSKIPTVTASFLIIHVRKAKWSHWISPLLAGRCQRLIYDVGTASFITVNYILCRLSFPVGNNAVLYKSVRVS